MAVGWFGVASIAAAQVAGPFAEVELPARVEAEHYDAGDPGVAWSDTDAHAGVGDFRVDDDVDAFVIERVGASGQALLGRTRDGEFVQYTVEVAAADEFEVRLRVASGADAPGAINVDVDGARVGTVDANAELVAVLDNGWDRCDRDIDPLCGLVVQAQCDAVVALVGPGTAPEGDICSWSGVRCEGAVIVSIDSGSSPWMGLGGLPFPAEIGDLTDLRRLGLGQQLFTSLPPEIGNLTKLTSFEMVGHGVRALPAEFGQLTSLTEIVVVSGPLQSVPSELGDLVNLEILWLEDGELTSLPQTLSGLDLDWVNLTENRLSGDISMLAGGLADGDLVVALADGAGGNDCLTTSNAELVAVLDDGWDRCDAP